MLASVTFKPAMPGNQLGFGALSLNLASMPAIQLRDDLFHQVDKGSGIEKPESKPQLVIAKSLQQALSQEGGQVSYMSAYTPEPIPSLFVGKAERRQLLRHCAEFIQQYKHSALQKDNDVSRSFVIGDQDIRVSPVNFSSDGALLKLDISGKPFGLKLYDYALEPSMPSDERLQAVASAYQDAAVGFYMNAKEVPNVVRMEACNPDEGWVLQQYVPRNGVLSARTGPSLVALIQGGIVEIPEIHDKNCYRVTTPDGNPYDVVIELSALRFQPERTTWGTFTSKLAQCSRNAQTQEFTSLVFALPENKRLAAFEALLAHPDPKMRHAGISALSALPAKDVETAIDLSMTTALGVPQYQRSEQRSNTQLMRTAVRIFLLPTPQDQWRKFNELLALNEPYSALGLGAAIPCLPHEYQLAAIQRFLTVFQKPVTVPAVNQPFMVQVFDPREYLFEELMNIPPETFIKAAHWMISTDPSLRLPVQKALWYFDQPTRQKIWQAIS